MRMRHFFTIGPATLLAVALAACGPDEAPPFHGELYFAQGSYLMRFNLREGSIAVVDNLGDKTVREISGLGPGKLLVAETATVNRRSVPRISWIDLATGESAALYSGVRARYLEAPGIIVYDDGSKLYSVPQRGSGIDEVIYPHRLNQLTALGVVSGTLLLLETESADEAAIHSWDAHSGELQELAPLASACRLQGAVWIDSLQRLACRPRARSAPETGYVLARLDGVVDGKLALPGDRQFLALAYLETQDALILQETSRGLFGAREKSAVWAYRVLSGERIRLAADQDLGGSVVYADY